MSDVLTEGIALILPGPIKLKSNEQINVSKEDAGYINRAAGQMSPRHYTAMKKEMLQDKMSFNRVLGFAKALEQKKDM